METIEKKVGEILKEELKNGADTQKRESYEKALTNFNILIDRGLTSKRGNKLSSITTLSFDIQK